MFCTQSRRGPSGNKTLLDLQSGAGPLDDKTVFWPISLKSSSHALGLCKLIFYTQYQPKQLQSILRQALDQSGKERAASLLTFLNEWKIRLGKVNSGLLAGLWHAVLIAVLRKGHTLERLLDKQKHWSAKPDDNITSIFFFYKAGILQYLHFLVIYNARRQLCRVYFIE